MDYSSKINGNTLEFSFQGNFSFDDNGKVNQAISEISDMECDLCSIDLSGLKSIDSAGLGMLLLMNDAAAERNKNFGIKGAAGQVSKMLEISKFSEIISIS